MDKKEQTRLRVERYRNKQKALQSGSVTPPEDVTQKFKDGIEMVPAFGTLPERPRYLTLSDGQVLDRANQPKADLTLWPGWKIEALRRCNLTDSEYHPNTGSVKVLSELKAKYGRK